MKYPLLDRILARVSFEPNNCWLYRGALDRTTGYGRLRIGGRTAGVGYAHRAVYELLRGNIPVGLQLDHLCRNRACANPLHLEAVSQRENLLRGAGVCALNAHKTVCKRGHAFDDANTVLRLSRFVCYPRGRDVRQSRLF
jgi:hypothetical protein